MMAPSLAGSPRVNGHRDYIVKALLKGLSGPLDGVSYSEVMVPMGANTDEWVAAVASYVRTSFGNAGGLVTADDVARARAVTTTRRVPWTQSELEATLPRLLDPQPTWTVTASHNSPTAGNALSMRTWSAGAPQAKGMWYQVELAEPALVTELQFDVPTARAGAQGGVPSTDSPPAPFPRAFQVETSMDGRKWGKAAAEGKGVAGRNVVVFAPVRAKFVRIIQTEDKPDVPDWTMTNVRLFEVLTPAPR
jgi:hypothetical protein